MRLGQNLLVLIKKKNMYTSRDCRTVLSSDVCTIGIIRTNVYPAASTSEKLTVSKPHQITQNHSK